MGNVALFEVFGLRVHFAVEHAGEVAVNAKEIPAGDGEVSYEGNLGLRDGAPLVLEPQQELLEQSGVFVLQDEGFGGDAVLERVVV